MSNTSEGFTPNTIIKHSHRKGRSSALTGGRESYMALPLIEVTELEGDAIEREIAEHIDFIHAFGILGG